MLSRYILTKRLRALIGQPYDEESVYDLFARAGERHVRMRQRQDNTISVSNTYLEQRQKTSWSLRRDFSKAIDPKLAADPEKMQAELQRQMQGLEARMARWQEGRFSLVDLFYIRVSRINLPEKHQGRRVPKTVVCLELDGRGHITGVAAEPYAGDGFGRQYRF